MTSVGKLSAPATALHITVHAEPEKLEHLARYIARPPIATERLALTDAGSIRYPLKTTYRDGTTHAILDPPDRQRYGLID